MWCDTEPTQAQASSWWWNDEGWEGSKARKGYSLRSWKKAKQGLDMKARRMNLKPHTA